MCTRANETPSRLAETQANAVHWDTIVDCSLREIRSTRDRLPNKKIRTKTDTYATHKNVQARNNVFGQFFSYATTLSYNSRKTAFMRQQTRSDWPTPIVRWRCPRIYKAGYRRDGFLLNCFAGRRVLNLARLVDSFAPMR